MPAENKPCPFCGASLFLREDSTGAFYEHGDLPDDAGCVIATLCVEFDMLDQWNRRAGTKEAGQPDVQQLKPKMPGVNIVETFVLNEHADASINERDKIARIAREVYEYLAGHFGR